MEKKFDTVILAEKPAQAKEYAKALGIKSTNDGFYELKNNEFFSDAVVTYAFGHLIEMVKPDHYKEPINAWNLDNLPFFPTNYEFDVTKGKTKQFNIIKRLLKNCNRIINATDYGREGSNIFYSILSQANINDKPILRYANGSLVHDDIRKQFKNLQSNDKDLLMFQEAKTRQISDWLVGMNLTSLYTNIFRKKGINEVFSVGRVQTPTLYLIYERQNEIENFKSKPFYELEGQFKATHGEYKGKAKIKTFDQNEIQSIVQKHRLDDVNEAHIQNIETKEKRTKAPKLFSLSLLQQKVSDVYKYSAKETLNIAQSLYDKKILSYPRTDTPQITHGEFEYLKDNLEKYKATYNIDFIEGHTEPRNAYVIDQVEEHHAIIPTNQIPSESTLNALNEKERNVLNLVVKTTLAMFAEDYVYDETKVETNVNELIFYTTGKIEKNKGWKAIFKNDQNKKENEKETKLPQLEANERVKAAVKQTEGKTKPPQYYSDKDLIQVMTNIGNRLEDSESKEILNETKGLGTEATRADVIEGLLKRDYVEIVKHRYHVTSKGKALCSAIQGTLLASPEMTANWEKHLKEIGDGSRQPNKFIKTTQKFIEKELSLYDEKLNNAQTNNIIENVKSEKIIADCPNCTDGKIQSFGKVMKCTDCSQVFFPKFFKKKLSDKQIKELISNGKTSNKLKLEKKDGNTYEAFLKLEKDQNKGMYIYRPAFK